MAKTNFKPGIAQIKKFKKTAGKALINVYKKEIISEIEGGRSPIDGQGRFVKYSDSYKKQIKAGRYKGKKPRPVNLKLTGDLLKSLFVKLIRGGFRIGFDNELADIHNKQGAGKSKTIRRMLPTNKGEQFNRSIRKRVREVLTQTANKIFKR